MPVIKVTDIASGRLRSPDLDSQIERQRMSWGVMRQSAYILAEITMTEKSEEKIG